MNLIKWCKFTLIELLVVIAIISVLASMLLPALGRAKEMGRMATCKGSFKQVYTASAMYADDNEEFLPVSNKNKTVYWIRWAISSYMNAPEFGKTSSGVFICPSVNEDVVGAQYYNTSYKFTRKDDTLPDTSAYGGWFHGSKPRRLSRILSNSALMYSQNNLSEVLDYSPTIQDVALAHPYAWAPDYFHPATGGDTKSMPGYLHNGRANILFSDGSVRDFRRYAQTSKDAGQYWRIEQ